jgi:GNAT superfamily N-acetyltransferase
VVQVSRPDGLLLSDDQSLLDLDRCHSWLASSYWASDRSRADMARSFSNSQVFGVYRRSGAESALEQLALARAVTDSATFCWIADVFVDDSARGRGIGTWMVGVLVDELKRGGVRRFLLGTRDAHGVYQKVGFHAPRVPGVLMEIDERATRPNADDLQLSG